MTNAMQHKVAINRSPQLAGEGKTGSMGSQYTPPISVSAGPWQARMTKRLGGYILPMSDWSPGRSISGEKPVDCVRAWAYSGPPTWPRRPWALVLPTPGSGFLGDHDTVASSDQAAPREDLQRWCSRPDWHKQGSSVPTLWEQKKLTKRLAP